MASSITAYPGHYVEDVQLSNVDLTNMGSGTLSEAEIKLPENPGAYPENRMYGQVYPTHGLFIRHVKGLKIDQLKLKVQNPDHRPAIWLDDVFDSVLNKVYIQASLAGAAINIRNSKNIRINYPILDPAGANLIQTNGTSQNDISITGWQVNPVVNKH